MADHEVWDCERRFWLDGSNFYKEHVAPDAVLVLPVIGIVDRAAGLAWARKAPRWNHLTFSNRIFSLAAETAVLAYEAYAEAAKPAQTYYACCSSTYVRRRESWMLVAHQQSALANIEQQLTERSALGVFFNS
ncbi:MAG TPA: hypothetical protein VN705_06950 [Steroidobacteraceae bacterium]|jgi:hypothetical protein|nr:hypothetical protein [Steroidobacteraceae bacterium]